MEHKNGMKQINSLLIRGLNNRQLFKNTVKTNYKKDGICL